MSDLVDQAAEDEVVRICELRLLDAQKALSRANAQLATISRAAHTEREPTLSRLGYSIFGKKKALKKCVCGGLLEPEASFCGDCGKKLAAAASPKQEPEVKAAPAVHWVMVMDSAGRPYYWNQSDDTTSWVPPPGWVTPPEQQQQEQQEGNAQQQQQQQEEEEDFVSEPSEDEAEPRFSEVGGDGELIDSEESKEPPLSPERNIQEFVSPFSPLGRRRHSKFSEEFDVLSEDNLSSGAKPSSWKSSYAVVGLMGLGAFGSVHLIEHRSSGSTFALKAVNLFHLREKQKRLHEAQLANEKLAFSRITDHRFLLSCFQIYEEENVTFLLMDACLGGDLSFIMSKGRHFTERVAQFYGACLILALEHLHSKDVVHCDVKPENVLIDSSGYPKLCDYGNSKDLSNGNVVTELGTIEYCAPEIVQRKPHGAAVDVWALGVLLCELATGFCPFAGADRSVIVRRIVSDDIAFSNCSADLTSLLRVMLQRDPATRAELKDLKHHKWFTGLDWEALETHRLPAPIIPTLSSNKDLSNFVVMEHVDCSVCQAFDSP